MQQLLSRVPKHPVRCPCCRLRIDGKHVWDYRNCVACGAVFRVRRRYLLTTYLLALVISGCIAYAVGNRDSAFLSLTFLLVLPTAVGMWMVNVWLFPIDIAVVRTGWTPGDSESDQAIAAVFASLRDADPVLGREEPEAPASPLGEAKSDARERLPFSTLPDPPVSLEGIVIAIGFAALLAWHVYQALEPHLVSRTPGP